MFKEQPSFWYYLVLGPVWGPPYLNNWKQAAGLEPTTIEGKHLYGWSSSPLQQPTYLNQINYIPKPKTPKLIILTTLHFFVTFFRWSHTFGEGFWLRMRNGISRQTCSWIFVQATHHKRGIISKKGTRLGYKVSIIFMIIQVRLGLIG